MVSFRRVTLFTGYLSFALLFGIAVFLFMGFVQKESLPVRHVSFRVEERANQLNLWRITNDRRYHIIAKGMLKEKNGTVELFSPELWIYQKNSSTIYIKGSRAKVYPDNNVFAGGQVELSKKDLHISGRAVMWLAKREILRSEKSFSGFSGKSIFRGKSFVYYVPKSELIVKGADVWLK